MIYSISYPCEGTTKQKTFEAEPFTDKMRKMCEFVDEELRKCGDDKVGYDIYEGFDSIVRHMGKGATLSIDIPDKNIKLTVSTGYKD